VFSNTLFVTYFKQYGHILLRKVQQLFG